MLVLFTIVLFFTCKVSANSQLKVVAEEFHPYQYQIDNEAAGIAVEIVNEILAQNQLSADIEFLPWARAYLIAKETPNTILLSVSRTKKRENLFHWIGKIDKHELHLWVNDKLWQTNKLSKQQLTSIQIGVPRNGHQQYFITHHPTFKDNPFVIVNTKEQLLKMLNKGRVDALLGDEKLLKNRLRRINLNPDIIRSVHKFKSRDTALYIAISKSTDIKLVNALKSSFEKYSHTKEFQTLINWR